jgi:hypothetical protein
MREQRMFSRTVGVASAAGLVFALAGMASAGAPPVTGTVSCSSATGALTVKPAVGTGSIPSPKLPGPKKFKEKLAIVATATGCSGSQSGTKFDWPIEGAVLKAKVKVPFLPNSCNGGDNDGLPCTADSDCPPDFGYPGSECGDRYPNCLALASGGFSLGSDIAPKAKIKWTNTTDASVGHPKPKTKPVAKSTLAAFDFGDAGTDPDIHVMLTGIATKGAFLGQQVEAEVHLDDQFSDLLTRCGSCECGGELCSDIGADAPGPLYPKGCDKTTGLYSATFGADNSACTKAGKPWPCCTGVGTGTCVAAVTNTTIQVVSCKGEGYGPCTDAPTDCCASDACSADVCCVPTGSVSPNKKAGGTDCCNGSCTLVGKTCVCD